MGPQISFKRKFPRRKFNGYVGILYRGVYIRSQCVVLGEGGLAFLVAEDLPNLALVVVTFKIPGDVFISIRGEVKNSITQSDAKLVFYGIQFFSLPIDERRKIRSYVSSRTLGEEVV
jgi:hypothetical protein